MFASSLLALVACSTTPDWLIRTDAIEPGEDCANGGLRVLGGTDVDGDQILEDNEVKTREWVCNGVDGADGSATLVLTSAEPAGSNCPEGGARVDSGVDDNADGQLSPDEIDVTTYVCDGQTPEGDVVWYGSYTIYDAADAARLAGFTAITGNLEIHTADATSLPDLRIVAGNIYVFDADTDDGTTPLVLLPALEQTNGLRSEGVDIDAPVLSYAVYVDLRGDFADADFLSRVTSVGSMNFSACTFGDDAGLASIESIDDLTVWESDISLAGLTSATSVYVYDSVFEASNLRDASSVNVTYATSAPFLRGVTSLDYLYVADSTISASNTDFTALTSVDQLELYASSVPTFSSLSTVSSLSLYSTTASNFNGLSALRSVTSLYAYYNSSLSDISDLRNVRATSSNYAYFYNNPSLCDSTTSYTLAAIGFTSYSVNNYSGC